MRSRLLAHVMLSTVIAGCANAPVRADEAPAVYSNVHYVEEAGDLYGFELELVHRGDLAEAVLRYYQGNNKPDVDHLKGKVSASKPLQLRGETKDGAVEVIGREKKGRFVGRVIYRVGSQSNRFELDLPLKK